MLVSTFAILATILPVLASHQASPPHLRHRRLAAAVEERRDNISINKAQVARSNEAHAQAQRLIRRKVNKRGQQCRPRQQPSASSAVTSVAPSSAAPAESSAPSSTIDNQQNWAHPSTTSTQAWSEPSPSPSPAYTASADEGNPASGAHFGILAVTDNTCGWSGASDNEPNGSQDWLNCGVNAGGWTPPHVSMEQLIATDLNADGIFAPCAAYIDKFQQYGAEFNVYPIMLASFAMQESTCNPNAVGGGGEAGLMQIAPPNCEAGNDCWNVDYNIRRGAQLFRGMIDANNGNVLAAMGAYNGWQPGMTVASATASRWTACRNQNNLDYIYQFCNGWLQNKNAYSMGSYFNLKDC